MKRFIGKIENEHAIIEGEELTHLRNVLRLNVGDQVIVINGDGCDYLCQIIKIDKNIAFLSVKSKKNSKNNAKNNISLFISAIKREKLELVVQKAVEVGIKNLFIFESDFSTMKLKGEKIVRYQKIMQSATKQCERADFMNIQLVSFDQMLYEFNKHALKLFANERNGEEFDFSVLKTANDIAILIGCEGGFSAQEKVQILKTKPENISLGSRILRAETAAILLSGIASLFSGN